MQDQMELQRLQPSDIKNIEVISNPGARYDASVKSVIRITTKKPQGEGFSFDNNLEISCQRLLCRQDRGTQNRLQYRLLLVW